MRALSHAFAILFRLRSSNAKPCIGDDHRTQCPAAWLRAESPSAVHSCWCSRGTRATRCEGRGMGLPHFHVKRGTQTGPTFGSSSLPICFFAAVLLAMDGAPPRHADTSCSLCVGRCRLIPRRSQSRRRRRLQRCSRRSSTPGAHHPPLHALLPAPKNKFVIFLPSRLKRTKEPPFRPFPSRVMLSGLPKARICFHPPS